MRKTKGDEIAQFGEVGVGDGHEVDDGRDLLCQGEGMSFTEPKVRLEPERVREREKCMTGEIKAQRKREIRTTASSMSACCDTDCEA